ncbi:hypothetical protein PAJ34TS1_00230 [Paenibacillus azoreducens]
MAQYDAMNNVARGKVKDGPAFVGGLVRTGGERRRMSTAGAWSHLISIAEMTISYFPLSWCWRTAYAVYSTHSHRPQKPKYRLIIPADRNMSPDEYAAVSRKLAEQIGMNNFDKTTFDVHRLMYLPSCSKDAEPVLEVYEGRR